MPDRETRLNAMLDLVESVTGANPRVLDLAGGTGSITRRLLTRLPGATSVVLDIDPVLLCIAQASFAGDNRVQVIEADLTDPKWAAALPPSPRRFDTVLTATALHWLPPTRVATLYQQLRALLRPGGLLGNADHMPDPGLPALSSQLAAEAATRSARLRRRTGATDWDGWWTGLRELPELADALERRDGAPPEAAAHTGSDETSAWHITALRDAGYTETGLWWRAGNDALVVAINPADAPSSEHQ